MNGPISGHVLVVEDDPVQRARVRYALEDAGIHVTEAADGKTALQMTLESPPDAIVLDLGLPDIDGLRVLEIFRERIESVDIPVVVVTSKIGDALIDHVFALGAYDFVAKPIRENVLVQRVRSMLHASVAQRRLTTSERQMTTLIGNVIGTAIFTTDAAGRIDSWNASGQSLTGFDAEDVLGRCLKIFCPPDDACINVDDVLRSAITDNQVTLEGERRRKDGSIFFASHQINPIFDHFGTLVGFANIMHDRTKERALETQLHHSQKMDAIGQLTGGLAHDFNNLLGVIVGNLDLCSTYDDTEVSAIRKHISEAIDASMRGAKLTQRLLAFARRQTLAGELTEINQLISGMNRLFEITVGDHVDVHLQLSRSAWDVVVDRNALESSLLNLAANARDAMPSGGRLTISTRNCSIDTHTASNLRDLKPGDYTLIEVRDSGIGMTENIQSRVFEPFFTTKGSGRGNGLGLAMVFGFLAQSGGTITLQSQPGHGSVFSIYLPRAVTKVTTAPVSGPLELDTKSVARGVGQTILAVEDNQALLHVLEHEIAGLGYRVVTATSAKSALAILERQSVDVLFSDVVMAGEIDGIALAWKVLKRWPQTRIVMTTGFQGHSSGDTNTNWQNLREHVRFIAKPYRHVDLASVLADAALAEPQRELAAARPAV
jgi:PAS domain S-box-containing protein